MQNGPWTDFISDFLLFTEGEPSPEIFRRWSAISLVGGALERRVWVKAGRKIAFPNLYVMLVGAPGTGKFIIELVRDMWRQVREPGTQMPAFRVAPDQMTKASLVDALAAAKNTRLTPQGPPVTYHSLLIAAEEFGVLLPDYDQSYIATLNSIYMNKPYYEETRRTGTVKHVKIDFPQLNILGGATPSYLATSFPEEAWDTGLSRRLVLVYSASPPKQELFFDPETPAELESQLLSRLGHMSQLFGQLKWQQEAFDVLADWHRRDCPPVPQHSKLVHYSRSRSLLVQKLAIISAIARTGELVIELTDVKRAIEWLLGAEHLMPDIFREMLGKSDHQVLEELHYFVTQIWAKNGRKPVNTGMIWSFLSNRVPSEKIERIILTADRANIICRVGGTQDLWLPRPRIAGGESDQ